MCFGCLSGTGLFSAFISPPDPRIGLNQDPSLLTTDWVPLAEEVVTGVMVMVLVTLLAPERGERWFLGERRTVPVDTSFSAVTLTGRTVIT